MTTPYCSASDVLNSVSQIEIFNGRLFHNVATPVAFVVGGIIIGGISGAIGAIDRVEDNQEVENHLDYTPTSGRFEVGEVITQTSPVATATIERVEAETQPNREWVDQTIIDCSSLIDGALKARGYALPIPVSSPMSLALLRKACIDGASCNTFFAHVKDDKKYVFAELWCKSFKDFNNQIVMGKLDLPDHGITSGRRKLKFGVVV